MQALRLTSTEFPRTCETLEGAVAEGVAPGFVVGLWQDGPGETGDRYHLAAFGSRRLQPSVLPMLPETAFDFSSVSKVFATAALTAVLVDRGWIQWRTRLAAIFPDYPYRDIELAHLLSHTAGFTWWEPFYEKIRMRFLPEQLWKVSVSRRQRAMRSQLFCVSPLRAAGEKVEYSDISALLLGFALEEVTQMPLHQAVRKLVWEGMGIRHAQYRFTTRPPDVLDEAIAATELSPWHETVLQGQVHDENCWAMGGYSGHSGVFGTADDLMRFSRALFRRFLSNRTLAEMWAPYGAHARTLGWDMPAKENASVGKYFSPRSVGHLGFTGTSLWIDPEAKLAVTLLSNRVHPTRENIAIRKLRPALHDAIRLDLGR